MKDFEKTIRDSLNGDANQIELVSQSNNIVFKVNTNQWGVVYAKFYRHTSSHIDHELELYQLVNANYLKEIVYISPDSQLAIFKELRGKTLDELSSIELEQNKDKIINSLIEFFESISQNKVQGYGLLDDNLAGKSQSFNEFIIERQTRTQVILQEYPNLRDAFQQIYSKYKDLLIGEQHLTPIDTNFKNIMITENQQVKFIDPGELISGPKLMGYGDFVAHCYHTPLYDALMGRLKLNQQDEKRLRIYAVFSSLNILAFLKERGVEQLEEVIPYGNQYPFAYFIQEHLKYLDVKDCSKTEREAPHGR